MQRYDEPVLVEKIIAVLSYLSSGWIGLFWLVFALLTKNVVKPFLKYHIFQSIFIAFLFYIISIFLGLIMNIFSNIPFLGKMAMALTFYLNAPFIIDLSVIQIFMTALILYLIVTCALGQYSYVPWVSDIIKTNVQ